LIWAVEGDPDRLGSGIAERIDRAARAGGIRIHPLSVWEVGMLVQEGRLTLAGPIESWVDAALALPGVTLLPLTATMALEAARLPDDFTGDPVDRMLVAAARLSGAVLLTRDRRILRHASGASWVVES
jgi:PIN domain nuclease of toxin-antitoxin system